MAFRSIHRSGGFRSWRDPSPSEDPEPVSAAPSAECETQDLETLLAEARAAGADETRAELEMELVQLREVVETLAPALQELETLRRQTLTTASEDIAEIVRLFARRVVHDALAMHPDALHRLVLDAVSQLPEREDVTIAVSPHASENLVRSLGPDLRERVVVDPDLSQGAIVRTRHASLDASLDTAMAGLETALQDWLGEQWWVDGEAR